MRILGSLCLQKSLISWILISSKFYVPVERILFISSWLKASSVEIRGMSDYSSSLKYFEFLSFSRLRSIFTDKNPYEFYFERRGIWVISLLLLFPLRLDLLLDWGDLDLSWINFIELNCFSNCFKFIVFWQFVCLTLMHRDLRDTGFLPLFFFRSIERPPWRNYIVADVGMCSYSV